MPQNKGAPGAMPGPFWKGKPKLSGFRAKFLLFFRELCFLFRSFFGEKLGCWIKENYLCTRLFGSCPGSPDFGRTLLTIKSEKSEYAKL